MQNCVTKLFWQNTGIKWPKSTKECFCHSPWSNIESGDPSVKCLTLPLEPLWIPPCCAIGITHREWHTHTHRHTHMQKPNTLDSALRMWSTGVLLGDCWCVCMCSINWAPGSAWVCACWLRAREDLGFQNTLSMGLSVSCIVLAWHSHGQISARKQSGAELKCCKWCARVCVGAPECNRTHGF